MSAASLKRLAVAVALLATTGIASAQDLLIRNATVHTASARGTLQAADVLVRNGRIAAVGSGLAAPGTSVLDAQGKPLTPALFGGVTDIGVEEVSGESATVDNTLALGANAADMQVRPAGVSRAKRESAGIRPRTSSTSWSSSIHCAARELPLSEAASPPRVMNRVRGPIASRLPSSRTAPPWPPMKEPPARVPADSSVQPMPSTRATGTSTDSGL